MIACLYLEDFGIKLPGGIWTAWKTQVAALRAASVEVSVTDPKQSRTIFALYSFFAFAIFGGELSPQKSSIVRIYC